MKNEIVYKNLDEKMYEYIHKSGLKVFVIPKKGYYKKTAAITTKFGSINNKFVIPGDDKVTEVPDGIAHFLEHKLFEQEDGSVMDKFSALGSSPNAYTTFNLTSYLFSATDKFEENLELLLHFVQNPYLTEESVEKEKHIIGQEIKMYQDDPQWRVFFNLLNGFYSTNPVRNDIAGSVESIEMIDKQTLHKCYDTFYHPSNMILTVVGDVDENMVFNNVEKQFDHKDCVGEIKRIFPKREEKITKNYIEQGLSVSTPLFQIGFMEPSAIEIGIEMIKYEAAIKLILDMLLGRGSKLYEQLYSGGLINNTFDIDCNIEENFAFSAFGGESIDPVNVRDIIVESLQNALKDHLNKEDFERKRRAMIGRFIRQFNSIDKIAHGFISVYFKGTYLFDYFDVYDKINIEYTEDVFRRHFNIENMALSVIKPI